MKNSLNFILNNKLPIIVGFLVFSIYIYNTFSGNRICDCEKTEKDKPNKTHRFYNSNNYNHK